MSGPPSRIGLRFAGLSALCVALAALAAGFAGFEAIRSSGERSAEQSARQLIAAPVASILGSGAPGEGLAPGVRDRLDAVVTPLLSTHLQGVRIWANGSAVYTAGTTAGASPDGAGVSSTHATPSGGDGLFVTFVNDGSTTIEVDELAAPIDVHIAASQRIFVLVVTATALALFLLLQAGFRLLTGRVISEQARLLRLHAAGDVLRSSLDTHDVLTQLSRDCTVLAKADYGLVTLYDQESGDLILRATYEQATGTIAHHQRAIEEWLLRRAVATGTNIVRVQQAGAYHQFFGPDLAATENVRVLCVPMPVRDSIVGVLAMVQRPLRRRGGFAGTDIRAVADLAAQGAMAIEQALLFARVRAYANEVELSYDSTLKALMAALDAKDDVTEGHCERVARLTVHLARSLGIEGKRLVDMERGALLHDVGKIGVPDAILKKPAALNALEWEAIRKHPLLAGVMISKVGFLEGATPILLYHHERYDGNGYPFQLSAGAIPLEARIFSVVDAYDAMTSDRPYRDAISHEAAMIEIEANKGTQFDPAVADAFVRIMAASPELRIRPPVRREFLAHDGDLGEAHSAA